MKAKNLLLTFAILIIALISGCAKDDFEEIEGVCPVVSSTIPANGALGVPFNQIISATFNEEMDAATINQSTVIVTEASGTAVAGAVTYSGTTVTFTPASPLRPNTTYTARITTGVKDVMGNALQTDYVWTFATGMIIVPVVISTDPTNNEINVALNKIITATFSVPMDPLTINNSTFTVKQGTNTVAGVITYTGSTVTFTPTNPLTANTIYTITITNGAKSLLQGTPLAGNYQSSFTTAITPTVTATDPLDNATGVNLNKTLTADFSLAMDPLTINATTFTLKQGTTVIPGVVTYVGTTASFNPASPLISGLVYTATITTGAKSALGIPLANNYVWDFTTVNVAIVTPAPVAANNLFFGVFGGNAGITNQGIYTVINTVNSGRIGTTAAPTLVTGFRDGKTNIPYTITGSNEGLAKGGIYTSGSEATQGLIDATAAYLSISPASKPGGVDPGAGELGGLTLAEGIYKSASGTFKITNGDLTLDAKGDPNAVWIFQTASALTVGDSAPSSVKFLNGVGNPKNVYWHVGSTAVINYAGGGTMVGIIIANSGVTLSSPANNTNTTVQTVLNGKAISLVSSVTMVNTIINVPE
ncbi:Ig-like domain-containing protein [Flavobacterium sp. XS2P39]|uniref:Ig-like domain-containing protein n=1 Tax=Flavobacterium sp. XS2P39 TaxID=3401725 RepID=UPI003AAE39AF